MCEQMKTLKQQIKMLLRDGKQYNWLSLETGDAYDQLIWEPGPDCGKGFPSGKKRGVLGEGKRSTEVGWGVCREHQAMVVKGLKLLLFSH